jgi:lysophospholipase L1-like esterase
VIYVKKKIVTLTSIVIGILLLSGCLFLLLADRNQPQVENVKAVAAVKKEQQESTRSTAEVDKAEEVQTEQAEESEKPLTQNIKDKVREVVEVALDFFTKDQKIVAIGDSLTEGIGDETKSGGYVGILNHTFEDNNLDIKVENYGKKGIRSDQLLTRLDKDEISTAIKDADVVLITIGANDIMKVLKSNFMNVTMEPFQEERVKYIERLKSIVNKINHLNPDAQIHFIGFYNPFERHFGEIIELGMIIDSWNEAAGSLANEYPNVTYIPTKDLFSNADLDLLAEDEFHPNTSGYKRMAQRVLEYLEESLGKNQN